jgi:hypothetical protein
MLAHALPKGSDDVAPTTRRFYRTSQRTDIKALVISSRSNCQMIATLRTNFSGVTIAPHENPN